MKVITSKNDTKKRKRDESQDSIDESPKKAKVHAQRKFAQGASYNSPAITLIKDKVRPHTSVSSPGLVLSAKRPNTEDFLTFLCFRRTSILPPKLDFFKDAFKQQPVPPNCIQKTQTSSSAQKNQFPENAVKASSKKCDKNESAKKTQTPVQALRRKYQEQRLAKQNPTNVTKLAQKVKGKNMIRTRSSTLQEEKGKPKKEVILLNDGKEALSGLRSGLQRTPPNQSKLLKKNKKVVEMKNLRSRFKGNLVNNVARTNHIPEKKAAKNSPRVVPMKKFEVVKNVKSPEYPGKTKDLRLSTKKFEGLSDFSSDDNEPLLTVRKGKPFLKGKKLANGVKDLPKTNSVKTRSQISEILPPTSNVAIRPTRKTKEAAAIYMEMITKKLVSPEKSGDDDRSSVDSFPELPNAKRNEQRETEIRAKAMAQKKGSMKENDGKERGLRSGGASNRKRELTRRSESSPGKIDIPKKFSKENQSKKIVKDEPTKKNIREPLKKQLLSKTTAIKKSVKEESSKKIADEPSKKIIKEELRLRSAKEDNVKKSIKKEKKNSKEESAKKDETSKKIVQDDGPKKVSQEDLPKRITRDNDQKKNLKEDIVKKVSQEELARKDIVNKVVEDDSTKKILKDEIHSNTIKEEATKKVAQEIPVEECSKILIKEELGKKSKDDLERKQDDALKKLTRDEQLKRDTVKKSSNEELSNKTVNHEISKKNIKVEMVCEEITKKLPENSGKKTETPKKITKDDLSKNGTQEDTNFRTGKDELPKEGEGIAKKSEELIKKTPNNPKKQDSSRSEEQVKVLSKDILQKKEDPIRKTVDELGKKTGKEEVKKRVLQDEGLILKDEIGKKVSKEDPKKTAEIEWKETNVITMDESVKEDLGKKTKVRNEFNETKKDEVSEKKIKEEAEKKDHGNRGKESERESFTKKSAKNLMQEEGRTAEENEVRPATRMRRQEESEMKPKKVSDRSSGQKKANSIPKKGSSSGSSSTSSSWLPPVGSDSNLVEAPTFYPTEKEFQDPLEFFERIRPAAESFGLCRIVPPSTFKPDCKVSDDMRFTAYNQYVHRMFHRWGPNIKEMMVIKKYLATQSISLKQPPWIGGIEVDLPRLYQSVQNCGGLMKVMEKKKWNQVADMMRIPKAAQDRVTKLDDIYCKYLLPYDTLSHDERQKLFDEVEMDWMKRLESPNDSTGEESEEESYIDECEECIVKGRNMALNQFYRIARNTMSMWFKTQEPSPLEVENEFWRHVSERTNHICVHSGSIDSSGWGYGFPIAKNNSFSRHPWNLKVLTNNSGSVLRSLGPVMGVTVPTLHVGMVFTAFCWYRDPHGLPWVEYLHTGAPKIWYGISDDNCSVFKDALTKLLPRYIKNKKIWLTSDTAMVPPALLVEQGVSLCHTIQKPGQFILVFPRAFTSSICTGYLVSESVYFAQPSWLTTAEQVFRDIQDCSEPTMFSLEKLLFNIATDTRSSVEVLRQVLPMVWHIKQKEIDGRKTLLNLGLKISERLPVREQGGNKKKKGRWAQDGEGDYECEVCRTNLCVSLVINSQEEGVLCLPHAIELLTQKRHQLKYCKLMYSYTQDELCELVEKLEQRIESKSQKKIQKSTK